jgi:hypothetical protein
MKALYNAIVAQIQAVVPTVLFVRMFNDQFNQTEEGSIYEIPYPFVLIEFDDAQEIHQLGGGYQLYDPVTVRLHIGHVQIISANQEENLSVFDLKDQIFQAMQKFEPAGAVAFVRTSETRDYQHTNIYHFIQEYKTNYIEALMAEPINPTTATLTDTTLPIIVGGGLSIQ